MIDNSQNVRIIPEIIWREMDGNAVIVSPKDGQVRVLNEIGTVIWHQLVDGKTLASIKANLVAHYEVSAERAEQDLDSFLKELMSRGVLYHL